MKKLFTFLFALIASVGIASAQSGTCGDNLTWELNTETGNLTISGTGAMADYPSASGVPWYDYRSSILSVVISDGVTSIENFAFLDCTSLTSITIPNSVASIGGGAFWDCSSLSSVTIPNSVTSIGSSAFNDCSKLTSVTIGNSVTSIGSTAFYNCSSLTSVTIGNSVTSIGESAFYNCSSLTSVTIPNSVTSIGESAFYNCSSLTSVTIGNSVTSIGEGAFVKTGIYNNAANWENGVLYINDCLIKAKQSVSGAYIIKEGTRLIGGGAFGGCSLTSITIPNSVASIGSSAFYECSSLSSVTIPNSVTSIGEYAFIYCFSLASINVDSNNPNYSSVDGVLFNKDKTTLIRCPECKRGAYTIPNSVTSIGDNAFHWCDALTSITIPNSVTSIGDNAFWKCDFLTSVTIPNSVTWIGGSAFEQCSNLTSITIPNSVTSLGSGAFQYCSSLTSITIPNSVTSIGDNAFSRCTGLTSVTIPNSVTSIGIQAFSYCSSLTSVTIPNSVTSIEDWAFHSCSSLTSITFEAITPPTIGDLNVFFNTNNCPIYVPCGTKDAYVAALNENNTIDESRVIEKTFIASGTCGAQGDNLTWELSCDSILTISGTGAMADYTSASKTPWYGHRSAIKTVLINDGVTSIGEYAFPYCYSLTSVTIPNSVTSIGDHAFAHCSSLTSVTIPNSVTSIGEWAFDGCSSLTSVTIGNSVTWIGRNAFLGCSSLTSVTFESITPLIIDKTLNYTTNNCLFYVPCGTKEAYVAALNVNNTIDESRVIEKLPYTYSVLTSESTLGSITITQEPTCTEPLIFRADAAEGYQFTQWSDGNTDNPRSLILTQDTTLKAEFELAQCLLASGTCGAQGDNLTWELSCDSVLTISGTGAMADYYYDSPWYEYRSSVQSVIINDGVKSIGNDAFSGCSSLTSITIPNSVTSIGGSAFYECSSLTSITIPNSVTSIRNIAFAYCSSLTSVTIPNSVTSIGYRTFDGCSSLISITIPNSVTSIGEYAFQNCSSLTSVTIPNSVTSIGSSAFYFCSSLTSVTIPNSVTSIGEYVFRNCSSLKSMIVESGNTVYDSRENCNAIIETATNTLIVGCPNTIIPNSVTSIGRVAFHECSSLTSITIPNSVTSIGRAAFWNCSSLTLITIPNSVTSIGRAAFDGTGIYANEDNWENDVLYINDCLISEKVSISGAYTIKAGTRIIAGGAFFYCYYLTSITVPNSVTSIGDEAFYGCRSLSSITIPNSVTSIGSEAFAWCSSLTSVTFEGRTPPSINRDVFNNTNNCLIYVPCGTKDAYVAALNVNNTIDESRVIEKIFIASGYCGAQGDNLTWELSCDSVLTISGTGTMADYTFASKTPWYEYRSSIQSVIITDGVTSIGEMAFFKCSSLTSITIPNSVTSIGHAAFRDCSSLTSVTIPNSVTSIGDYAFHGCSSLTSVTIPNSVTSIGDGTFNGCSSLTSVTIPNSVTSIGDGAFYECSFLTSVTIPNGVTSIGEDAFMYCSSLTSVTIPNGVTSIGEYAFYYCSSLSSVTIPNSVTSIGDHAFWYCKSLTSITIPNSVTSIGDAAFWGCSSLTSVTIPNSVTSIGYEAFDGCSSLTSVTFERSTPPLMENAFYYINDNCSFYVPCGTKEAYVAALNVNNTTNTTIDESRVIEKLPYTYSILTSDSTLGSVTITQEPTCTAPLIFRADAAEGYRFAQWSDGNTDNPRSLILTQDTTLKAEFELCTYTVTWLNYDSLVLELDTNVIYGTMPSYDSTLPAKPSTAEYTYTFAGWSPVVESVTGNTTYIAVFDEVLNAYTVTWLNYDSFVLELDTNVIYGTMPSYNSAVPAKPSTAEYTYTFAGWSPEVVATTEDATYTATYTSALRTYSVLVYGMNNNIILNGTYPYGESILVEAIPEQNYQFTQWSDGNTDNPRSLILTQDTILKALFEQIIIEQDTIIVTDSTDISDIITGGQDTIPHVEVQPGGEITIDRDDIGIGVITIITIGTESGQVHPWDGGYDNLKYTRVVMEYVLNPFGQTASPDKWYAFAVPFKVDMETGITRKYGNKSHVPGKDFMILEYDSELRSRTGSGWKEKKSGLLEPGHFYMLGIEGNCNRWLFEKVRNADVVGDKEKDLQHYAHGNSKNDGWHGLGNTTLEYVDMSFKGLNATYVYIYDNQHGRYNIYSIEELILAVGQPFFTQGDNDGSVAFTPNNGKGKGNGKKNMPIYAPSYDVQPSHPRVLLTIETEKINATPDRLYITLHDDNQCGSYRIGRDFMRMDKGSKQVPNFWCPMADGTQLSAHGISMPTTYTTIPLGIFTPAKGEYTINAHMQDMDDYIVELYYQNVCLGIVMQGVPFRLEMAAGTSYEYSILLSRRVSTDLNPAEDTQCDKDNKWYDVLGRPLPQDAHGIFIRKGEKIIK